MDFLRLLFGCLRKIDRDILEGISRVENKQHDIERKLNKMAETQDQEVQDLTDLTTQVGKIGQETTATLQKVADLEEALKNAGNVTPEVQAALDALKVQAQTTDDLVPDAPTA